MSFDAFQFDHSIADAVVASNYVVPTPIQEEVIPTIMEGRDVVGIAQTGTGKTAAFVLPLLNDLLHGPRGRVQALIIVPTRELAEQIHQDVLALGQYTRVRSMTLYGGGNINPQIERLYNGVEVVVACPGRLVDHINRRTIDLSLLRVLVLDEADRMLDMGFLPAIRRIIKHLPRGRQTLLFSATMPDDVYHLAESVLSSPVTVKIGEIEPVRTVAHTFFPVSSHLKTEFLYELLYRYQHELRSVLVFMRTKHRARRLAEKLDKWGHSVTYLQGDLSQRRRQRAIEGFRDGSYQIMVATDIAARGLDVTRISHVINYDVPESADDYIHRIGRTGRAEKYGDAFTFITDDDEIIVDDIEELLAEMPERRYIEGFDYSVPAPSRHHSSVARKSTSRKRSR